jgi:molybdopterin converting factor small subunit
MHAVTIELFGIPRRRAGVAAVSVRARTMAEAVRRLEEAYPGLAGLVTSDGMLSPQVLLSLDGTRFTGNLEQELSDGARLLLFSADAGG